MITTLAIRLKQKLFLIDGIGALATSVSLFLMLTVFQSEFGMPAQVLKYLVAIGCLFAVYSLSCYFLVKRNWEPFLKAIAFANITYCIATIILIVKYASMITGLGFVYFIGEIIVIGILVAIELKAVETNSR